MRNAIPLRWIEQAEARQVLTAALFERAPTPSWCEIARQAAAKGLPRVRSWLVPTCPTGWPVLAAQPALVRQAAGRGDRRRGDAEGGLSQW
jgi:hypothetical protein